MPLALMLSINTSTLCIAQVAKFCTIALNICVSSVWNLLSHPSGTYYFEMAPRCFEICVPICMGTHEDKAINVTMAQ
jgi:hypothetical protein